MKTTINYKGADYPVRTLDVRSLPECESEGYASVKVADETLLNAMGDESMWGDEERATDNQIMFYFMPGSLDTATDKQLIDILRVCF
jgi:hypothetical protein